MENKGEIARIMIIAHIDLETMSGKTYGEAIYEVAKRICCTQLEEEIDKSIVCFQDYYTLLAYKRDLGTLSRDTGTMSKQDIQDYERLRRLQNQEEILQFWKANQDCLMSAINTCYQMQKKPYGYYQELRQNLNSYDLQFLKNIEQQKVAIYQKD